MTPSSLLRTSLSRRKTCLYSAILTCARRSLAIHSGGTRLASFESLGIDKTVVRAVQVAFPNIRHPTSAQEEYIRAVLDGKDVLLKGQTGSGKSFGLLLALLNMERKFALTKTGDGRPVKMPLVTSLVLTPHRDLAYQFLHWIRSILDATEKSVPLVSLAQVLLRGSAMSLPDQIAQVHALRPQILIGTPQAVLEALAMERNSLDIHGISAVVVDEADYLLESLPKPGDKWNRMRLERKLERHPSPTRQILDFIYAPVREKNDTERNKQQFKRKPQKDVLPVGEPFYPRPQLVLSSATLRSTFRNSIMREGWITPSYGNLIKVGSSDITVNGTSAVGTLGGTAIQHCALIVAEDSVTNIPGAVEPITEEPNASSASEDENAAASALTAEEHPLSADAALEGIDQEDLSEYVSRPSPFNQAAFETIGVAFAVDVPRVALLVLPAEASVRRAVFDLRSLGINAHGLDVLDTERGGAYLLQKGTQSEANPALLVATLATIRGLDLPDLTHVFMMGVPQSLSADAYLHVAGRVGRFGKSGKVITILEPRQEIQKTRGTEVKMGFKDEPVWIQKIYRQIEVTPTKFEHFGDAPESDVDDGSRERTSAEDEPQR